jgi:hypothetical protein
VPSREYDDRFVSRDDDIIVSDLMMSRSRFSPSTSCNITYYPYSYAHTSASLLLLLLYTLNILYEYRCTTTTINNLCVIFFFPLGAALNENMMAHSYDFIMYVHDMILYIIMRGDSLSMLVFVFSFNNNNLFKF